MGFRFERLKVWPKALDFADRAISESLTWPRAVQSSLGDQVQRAAVSIITNIAEASGKRTGGSRRSFFDHAKGSTYEVIGVMTLARKRGLIDDATYSALYSDGDEIAAMLWGLMQASVAEVREEYRVESGIRIEENGERGDRPL
jgi:four helix bundle protein